MSKNKIKDISALKQKKFRDETGLFICEGEKIFETLYNSEFKISEIFALGEFIETNSLKYKNVRFTEITEIELGKISSLTNPQPVLAIVKQPEVKIEKTDFNDNLNLVLDNIQDPGNLGTIIRIADWFGIENIICSNETVEVYNPKVVQATMGSIFTVNVFYTDLFDFLQNQKEIEIYGTFMEGENIYNSQLNNSGFIVMGNEANGISTKIEKLINKKISIPDFNKNKAAESLNVSVATAIICSEFRKKSK